MTLDGYLYEVISARGLATNSVLLICTLIFKINSCKKRQKLSAPSQQHLYFSPI